MEESSSTQLNLKCKKKPKRNTKTAKHEAKDEVSLEYKLAGHAEDKLIRSFEERVNIGKEPYFLNNDLNANDTVLKKTKKKHKIKKQPKGNPCDNLDNIAANDAACIQGMEQKHTPIDDTVIKEESNSIIAYKEYESELQMPDIMQLIQRDLSEPYSIYTYRYFIHNWPNLCFLALDGTKCVGAIVCKLDMHKVVCRGYIAMLAVDKDYRKMKIGSTLVQKAIEAMLWNHADEVVLETEITNYPALKLYENLGFVRDKRLFHYYLNGVDALRLKLWFR